MKKPKCSQKINYRLSFLENEVRRDLRHMTGLRVLLRLVPATYASLVLDKRSGSDGQGVPTPLGKAATWKVVTTLRML